MTGDARAAVASRVVPAFLRPSLLAVAALLTLAATGGPAVASPVRSRPESAADAVGRVAIVPVAPIVVETGTPLSIPLVAVGGTAPYQWSPLSLPPGVTLGSGGDIGGAPSEAGRQSVDVEVVDALNATATAAVVLDVRPGPLLSTTQLPTGMVGTDYATTLVAHGGTPPYSFSVASGRLPGGLVLSSSGTLSGRPGTSGTTSFDARVTDAAGGVATSQLAVSVAPAPAEGYVTVDLSGQANTYGLAAASSPVTKSWHAAGVAVTPDGDGYWLVTTAGRVYGVGGARNDGSAPAKGRPGAIVAIAATPDGNGYWLVTATGRVYAFGDAQLLGSIPPKRLVGRIVGIAASPVGLGYWLVSSTGRVYRFGAAHRLGWVTPGTLVGEVVGIAAVPGAPGYWLADSDGQVYAYGAARQLEPFAGQPDHGVVAIAAAPQDAGAGYWLLTRSGGVYGFGAARNMTPTDQAMPGATRAVAIAAAR